MKETITSLVWALRFKSQAHKLVALRLASFAINDDGSGVIVGWAFMANECQMRTSTVLNCVEQLTHGAWLKVQYCSDIKMVFKFDVAQLEQSVNESLL